jgi:hypothetical protein
VAFDGIYDLRIFPNWYVTYSFFGLFLVFIAAALIFKAQSLENRIDKTRVLRDGDSVR